MAPKNLPPAAKSAKILEWFHSTAAVYSIKELEKLLPAVAAIHQAQVKEYIQNLTDENLVRVEKIGSGNWYWSFPSDARRGRERVLQLLESEEATVRSRITELETQLAEEMASREDDGRDEERAALMAERDQLAHEAEELDVQLKQYSDNDPAAFTEKTNEVARLKEQAIRFTDHLESLASYLMNEKGLDRLAVQGAMANACGEEWLDGEGLRELVL